MVARSVIIEIDYQHMAGTRFNYKQDFFYEQRHLLYGEFAHSMGIDRKPLTERDVTTDGMAYGGGFHYQRVGRMRAGLNVEYYFFEGSSHGAVDALEFDRGFVGFGVTALVGIRLDRYLSRDLQAMWTHTV